MSPSITTVLILWLASISLAGALHHFGPTATRKNNFDSSSVIGSSSAVSAAAASVAVAAAALASPAYGADGGDVIPPGCTYTGDGPYQYQRGNGNLKCDAGFVKGFAGEELIFTPVVLSGLYFAQKTGRLPAGLQERLDRQTDTSLNERRKK